MKAKVKKALTFIFQFVITFGILYCLYLFAGYLSDKEYESIDRNGKVVSCEVIKQGYMKGSYVDVVYYVKGKEFIKRENTYFSAFEFIPVGEKYLLKFDSLRPAEAYVMFDNPIFFDDEITYSVSGKVEKISDKNVCYYSYSVGQQRFERFQKLPDSAVVEVGKRYIVKYLEAEPLRSILIFN